MPLALELPPVIVSPVSNFCCDVIKSLGLVLDKSSTRTLAVALEVPPVIVSPTINLPPELSKIISLPLTSNTLETVSNSKRRLSIDTVRRNSPASRYS